MIRRPPRSTQSRSSAASDVYKRQLDQPLDVQRLGHPASVGGRSGRPRNRCTTLASARSASSTAVAIGSRPRIVTVPPSRPHVATARPSTCLLYTSDAADDLLCVDLGGR